MADIIVADRLTDANQKRLTVSRMTVSWAIDKPGLIAFDIPVKDALAAGVNPKTLLGKWLHYEHPTAGPWGGQVTNVLVTDGIAAVSGESWLSCLRGVVTTGVITGSSFAGTIRTLIQAAKAITGINGTSDSISGIALALSEGMLALLDEPGQDLYEQVLPGYLDVLAGLSPSHELNVLQPYGYTVDPVLDANKKALFRLNQKIGVDRSATVKLADAVTNTSGSWGDDLTDVINTVTLAANITVPGEPRKCKEYKPKKRGKPRKCKEWSTGTPDHPKESTATAKNQASIAKYGPRSLRITNDINYRTQQNLQNQAQTLADAYARNEQLATVRVARDPSELGSPAIFSKFREGDVVSVDLANEGGSGKLAVRYRALDVARDEMIVSGEAEIV